MGKNKYIESPDKLLELFEAYKKETKSTPRKKMLFVGKDGRPEYELLETPLTFEGFSIYCFNNVGSNKHYFENRDNAYNDYVPICTYIKEVIRRDQIEGGMVGQYNPSITQRLNGLKEQTDTTTTHNISILNIDPLDDSANNQLAQDSKPKKTS